MECIWGLSRNLLFIHCDRGSIGWPGKAYLFSEAVGLRGDVLPDLAHRRNNSYLNAWHKAGLSVSKVEIGLVFNMMRGPFQGCANFHTIKEAALQFYRSASWDNPLFQICYEDIARDYSAGVLPVDFGTEAHMQSLWQKLPTSALLAGAGSKMKLSRWMSWSQRARHIQPHMGELFMILLYISQVEGWCGSLSELLGTPAAASDAEKHVASLGSGGAASSSSGAARSSSAAAAEAPAPAAASSSQAQLRAPWLPPAAVGDQPPARAPVHGSRDGLEEARKKSKNTMHLVLKILARGLGRRIMVMMRMMTDPIEQEHRMCMTMFKTQQSLVQKHISMAAGGYTVHIEQIWSHMYCKKSLLELGFDMDTMRFDSEDLAAIEDDQALAMAMMDCIRCLMFNELLTMLSYSHRPPLAFAALLSDQPDIVRKALLACQRWWEALVAIEKAAAEDLWFAKYLRDMQWPSNCWCREVLVGLYETSFTHLPPDLNEEVLALFRGWCASVPVENCFNLLRASERAHSAKFLGRSSRWHRLVSSSLLEDHDRKVVTCDGVVRAGVENQLKSDIFEAKANLSFSLGDGALKAMGVHDRLASNLGALPLQLCRGFGHSGLHSASSGLSRQVAMPTRQKGPLNRIPQKVTRVCVSRSVPNSAGCDSLL